MKRTINLSSTSMTFLSNSIACPTISRGPRNCITWFSDSFFLVLLTSEMINRSPLQNHTYSDFSWEGHPPPDSDISFISSDKQFCDHMSSNSSNLSRGSFDSWQTFSSASSSAMSSERTSDESYSSLGTMVM